VETVWQRAEAPVATLVLAHGAGAGMRHAHMQCLAEAFARAGIETLRFNFPFIELGKRRVDPQPVSTARIAEAFSLARAQSAGPIWLGGHSYGGRMASHALLEHALPACGLVFCSFPLHPAGRPGMARAAHLVEIDRPLLFLSGTRDDLATPELLERVAGTQARAVLHWLDTADHGYRVRARERASRENVYDEAARVARDFLTAQHCNAEE